jgi:cellulose synthase/poly-beta-1,6-N-acetylglucosamine synthase-like glycosyltransferase
MIMYVVLTLFYIFQAYILIHLAFPVFLWCVQLFKPNSPIQALPGSGSEEDYAIIVTAYKQIDLIPEVVKSILSIKYNNYLVYIVADNCDVSELKFDDDRIIILRPEGVLSSNVKSHFYAINNFKRGHERLTIIDSDNLVHPEYLKELNKVFDLGYSAVQGIRQAKNLNTNYACLDAANDIYYRYVDKLLLTKAGSSSSLSGSGMAFNTSLYIACLKDIDSNGAGFDKILQFEIVIRKLKIAFGSKAIVYDEKTSRSDQLVKQRARWINTWFKFFKLGLKMLKTGVLNLNWNQLLYGIMLCRPPLFILLFLSLIGFIVNLFIMPQIAVLFAILAGCFVIIFIKSLVHFKADKRIYKSLAAIPKFIYFQVLALMKVRVANEISVATEHYIEEKK